MSDNAIDALLFLFALAALVAIHNSDRGRNG